MILENKTILSMGIRNKWSIAYGAAKSAYEHGAKLIFTFIKAKITTHNKIKSILTFAHLLFPFEST